MLKIGRLFLKYFFPSDFRLEKMLKNPTFDKLVQVQLSTPLSKRATLIIFSDHL